MGNVLMMFHDVHNCRDADYRILVALLRAGLSAVSRCYLQALRARLRRLLDM
jgi:hypothetical protein